MDPYLANWLNAETNPLYREWIIYRIETWLNENTNPAYRQWVKVRIKFSFVHYKQ